MRNLAVFAALFITTAGAWAQRLPQSATPAHYQLTFRPDFSNNTFSGNETIDVAISAPTKIITINAVDIKFEKATITSGAAVQTAKLTTNADDQMATFTFENMVPAGPAKIAIHYTGVLNSKLRGLYLSETAHHKYAVTQFESTSARWAYPSFDEPAYKATFDITAIIDRGDTAISNGSIDSDTPGPGDKHTIKFTTTPKMSTYLVALAIGDWKCISDEQDGIPLRICSVPGKEAQGKYALEATKHILQFYDQYYGIKYPFKKLDQLAVPDFEAGAMENTGAIIYREALLLGDEKTMPEDAKRQIASVIAHEMAHQWFGDLVTMKWWDDIWLNEGFATWMASKPLQSWKPEWKVELDRVRRASQSMDVDSVKATRPIHTQASTPKQIDALFDGIAYGKTAAVLDMIESYLGPEEFRKGVSSYLSAHAYANATAEDFWTAMTVSSHKPVDKIMPSFVMQAGVPFVQLAARCENGNTKIDASQKRFFFDPALFGKTDSEVWQIPVCMKTVGESSSQHCELLTAKQQSLALQRCGWVFPDVNAVGYYRYGYEPQALQQKGPGGEQSLSSAERISLLDNEWALVRAGSHNVPDYLSLIESLRTDHTRVLVEEAIAHLTYIHRYLSTDSDRGAFQGFVRSYLQPMLTETGTTPKPGESPETSSLRAQVFRALGAIGDDPQVIAQSRELTKSYMADPISIEPNLAQAAVRVAADHGDAQLYDAFREKLKHVQTPQEYYTYFFALASFHDPALLTRTLEWSLTPAVRNQDLPIAGAVLQNPYGRPQSWDFVKSHYADYKKKSTSRGPRFIIAATGTFCDPALQKDAAEFLAQHPEPGTERQNKQEQENAGYCIEMKQREAIPLAKWLDQHKTVHSASGQ
jgi:aminopeptidase N